MTDGLFRSSKTARSPRVTIGRRVATKKELSFKRSGALNSDSTTVCQLGETQRGWDRIAVYVKGLGEVIMLPAYWPLRWWRQASDRLLTLFYDFDFSNFPADGHLAVDVESAAGWVNLPRYKFRDTIRSLTFIPSVIFVAISYGFLVNGPFLFTEFVSILRSESAQPRHETFPAGIGWDGDD